MTVSLPKPAGTFAPDPRTAERASAPLDPVVIVLIDALARSDACEDHRAEETGKPNDAPRRDLR
jgi:hypothetical protein